MTMLRPLISAERAQHGAQVGALEVEADRIARVARLHGNNRLLRRACAAGCCAAPAGAGACGAGLRSHSLSGSGDGCLTRRFTLDAAPVVRQRASQTCAASEAR